jgi:hypothetical protein
MPLARRLQGQGDFILGSGRAENPVRKFTERVYEIRCLDTTPLPGSAPHAAGGCSRWRRAGDHNRRPNLIPRAGGPGRYGRVTTTFAAETPFSWVSIACWKS